MMFTAEQTTMLQAKLSPSNVKPAKNFGPKGDYIEGWHAIAEANRIFGFDEWSYSIKRCDCVAQGARAIGKDKKDGFGVSYVAHVTVAVGSVIREDVGAGHGYDMDLGLAHESAVKEAVTDALKRALRSFGNPFGLALYDKSRENVGDDAPTVNPDDITTYCTQFHKQIGLCKNRKDVEEAWKNGATRRGSLQIDPGSDDYERLRGFCKDQIETFSTGEA
jgi:DNA repair and recombination protein RAD52